MLDYPRLRTMVHCRARKYGPVACCDVLIIPRVISTFACQSGCNSKQVDYLCHWAMTWAQ